MARRTTIPCEYDELSEDNIYNRIIKTTCLLLVRCSDVSTKTKNALKKAMLYFSEVSTIEVGCIPWQSLKFTRENQSYQLLVNICQLILQGMITSDKKGDLRFASYLSKKNMYDLYEKFILNYYKKHWPQLDPKPQRIDWALDEEDTSNWLPEMWTDITLHTNSTFLIIDAKFYKRICKTKKIIRSNNLYQIFAYVKNKAAKSPGVNVQGILLYAKTLDPDQDQPDEKFLISGNLISVRTLDLGAPSFDSIKKELDGIAKALISEEN